MLINVLGCATSTGVPVVGCECDICSSTEPRNSRTRSSVFIQVGGMNVLIDSTPDLRLQALRSGIKRIDAVLYTHTHADHTHGIDDLRTFNFINKMSIPCYGSPATIATLKRNFRYIFDVSEPTGETPRLELVEVRDSFALGETRVTLVEIDHAKWKISGYRIGGFGYLTDCSGIPERSKELLRGLDVLIIGALRRRPHPAHFSVEEALAAIAELRPAKAYLTHMGHEIDYVPLRDSLPQGVEPCYDGLMLELPDP